MKYFGIFSNTGDVQTALNTSAITKPYVALVNGALDYNSLEPEEPSGNPVPFNAVRVTYSKENGFINLNSNDFGGDGDIICGVTENGHVVQNWRGYAPNEDPQEDPERDLFSVTWYLQEDAEYEFDGISYTGISIPGYAFIECSDIVSVELGDGVEYIGDYAFCDIGWKLSACTLGSSLKCIKGQAFQHAGIESFTIPASVEYIGENALKLDNLWLLDRWEVDFPCDEDCIWKTQEVIFEGTTPPGGENLGLSDVKDCFPIYVPDEALSLYEVTYDELTFIPISER